MRAVYCTFAAVVYIEKRQKIRASIGAEIAVSSYGLGPYSKQNKFGNLDGRSFEGRLYNKFMRELTEYVGGKPTIVQAALIEQCARIKLRLALMDAKMTSQRFTEHDSRVYLAWSNSLSRLLRQLGLDHTASASKENAIGYSRKLELGR
jgi:hypothetical protein